MLTRNVAISNDGRHIAIGEIGLVATKDRFYFPQGGGVYSSLGGKRVVPRIKWQKWPHTNIGFTNDGNLLVRLSPHGKLHFFDIVSGQFTAVTGDADWLVDLLSDDVVYTISLSALSHTRSAGEQS
ncbi:MAG TPA: hypothetical protein VF173_36185 [Thermoanaerobaculia bacterium]|nr:hypothetical protein [Thermoanaerobaculia bacterium]